MEVRDLSGSILYSSPTLQGMSLGGPLGLGEGDKGFDERIVRLNDGTHLLPSATSTPCRAALSSSASATTSPPCERACFSSSCLLFIAIPLALILAAFAGQAIARRALRPLERMTARAERITASNLGDRLDVANERDELGNMARVFNHLLERLEQAFRQLQRFTADASHELRTPLAAIRTISEVALEKPPTLKPIAKLSATYLRSPVASIKQ